jgi:hypothetical protein
LLLLGKVITLAKPINQLRSDYNLTQKELSEITDIPLKMIESWEDGSTKIDAWICNLLGGYLKQYPKNEYGIITHTKGVYTINQIKDVLLPYAINHQIYQAILIGDYANDIQNPLSHIKIIIQYMDKRKKLTTIVDELNRSFVKVVEIYDKSQIKKYTDMFDEMKEGVILFTGQMAYNQIAEMISH